MLGLVIVLTTMLAPAAVAVETPSPGDDATQGGEQATEQGVTGTLRDDESEPVEGVTIVVTDASGAEVAEAETDSSGQWEAMVPTGGTYTVELDTGTLPEGVELRDPENNPLEVQVPEGRTRPVIFQLGEGEADRAQAQAIARAVANGLKFGLIIAMAGVGLSLIFGTTGLINFAHGELVALGAMLTWYFNVDDPQIQLIGAAAIGIALTAAFGAGLERGIFLPLRRRRFGLFQLVIITIGISLLIRHLLLLFFGGSPRTYSDYVGQEALHFGPVSLTPRDIVIMCLSVLILVAFATMLQRSRTGKAIRAVADNPALASASGIDVDRVTLVVWTLGAALAASGGVLFGSAVAVDWFMGFRLLLLMFAAVILGGIGTAYGAMAGGLVIGLVTELSVLWFPSELKYMWALLALIVVLLVRPRGILGQRERIG
ncbi:branched-chain amino acid ABC transporter permease [Haloactinopolyspora alba]|uniref:branched-chain amino acid ABC transporter permease n=1 Tax=Haloactinopolyspora alba TaxID=648780 RepID=UPI0013ED2716|nr:branched-chain amino acid ABC transporter permease [Haloactinopolyspora alba]